MISQRSTQRWMYYLGIIFAFSLALSRGAINLAGLALLLVWILEGGYRQKIATLLTNPFTLLVFLFLLYQTLVLLWVNPAHIKEAINYSFKYIYFLIPLILYTSFPHKKTYHLLYAFLLGLALASIESLLLYFHLYEAKTKVLNSLSLHMWHTYYSVFLGFGALIMIALVKEYPRRRAVLFILFLSMISVLFLGVGRTGEVIFLLGLGYVLIKEFALKLRYVFAIFSLIFILLATLYTHNKIFKERIEMAQHDIVAISKGEYCSSLGMRLFTWKVAKEILESDPIFGLGTIDHLDYLQKALEDEPKTATCDITPQISNFHSQYIETFAQSGLIGLFLLLGLFISLWSIPIKDSFIAYVRVIFIGAFLFDFLLEYPFRVTAMLGLFALFSAIFLLQSKKETPT